MHQPDCPLCNPGPESVIIYRDDLVYAIVSMRPINRYHVMVVPNAHHESFVELPDPVATRIFLVAKRLSQAVRQVATPDAITHLADDDITRTGFNLVAHFKLHIIPRYRGDRVEIHWNRDPDPGVEVRAGYAQRLREALSGR